MRKINKAKKIDKKSENEREKEGEEEKEENDIEEREHLIKDTREHTGGVFRIFNDIADIIMFVVSPTFPEKGAGIRERRKLAEKEIRKIKFLSVIQGAVLGLPGGIAGILTIPLDMLLLIVAGISIGVKVAWSFGFNPDNPEEKKFIFDIIKEVIEEEGRDLLLLKGKTGGQKIKSVIKKGGRKRIKIIPVVSALENSFTNFKTINRISNKMIEKYAEKYMKSKFG